VISLPTLIQVHRFSVFSFYRRLKRESLIPLQPNLAFMMLNEKAKAINCDFEWASACASIGKKANETSVYQFTAMVVERAKKCSLISLLMNRKTSLNYQFQLKGAKKKKAR
jgi:hypothetical protein